MPAVTVVNAVRAATWVVPVGALAVCARTEQRGWSVEFADYQTRTGPDLGDPAAFAAWLDGSADVLGISLYASSLPLVLAAAPLLKRSRPRRLIVLGGPGTVGIEAALVRQCQAVDVVAHGEADDTLAEILEAHAGHRPWASVAGISCRRSAEVITTATRARLDDLDGLPMPAYHLANLASYLDPAHEDDTPFGVVTSRGCPFACAFCAIPGAWTGAVRSRHVGVVVDELRMLHERYGIRSFRVHDDTFTLDRRRVAAFCDRLIASGLGLRWVCHARIEHMDEALLEMLASAGCRRILYGVESGSDAVLRRLGKGFTVAQAIDVIAASTRHATVDASFMWGFPFESLEDLYDTVVALLVAYECGAQTRLAWYVPFPGAALTREWGHAMSRVPRDDLFPNRGHLDAYVPGPELRAVVARHPDVCASHYYLEHPALHAKVAFLRRWVTPDGLPVARPTGEELEESGRHEPAGEPAGIECRDLPSADEHCVIRTVGGRRFVFDADRLRAFRVSAFGERVFVACQRREAASALASELAGCDARRVEEAARGIARVAARFCAEGLARLGPPADR